MSIKQGLSGLYLICKDEVIYHAFKTLKDAIAFCRLHQIQYIVEV